MFNIYKLQLALKNPLVRITLVLLATAALAFALLRGDVAQDAAPVVRSQNIGEITALVAQRDKLDYLLIARPLADSPRYVYKFKDDATLHVVVVPSTSHQSLER